MKMNNIIQGLLILSFYLSACKNDSDLRGDAIIAGTVYLKNITLTATDSTKLANTKLYVQTQNAGVNSYLYSTTSANDGSFIFSNLIKGNRYWIFGSLDSMGLTYSLNTLVVAGTSDLIVSLTDTLSDTTNEMKILVLDSANSPVANFNVYVFNSKVLAAGNDSAGSIFQLISNSYGIASVTNIQAGIYYLNAKDSIGNILLSGRDTVPIGTFGIFNDTLRLQIN